MWVVTHSSWTELDWVRKFVDWVRLYLANETMSNSDAPPPEKGAKISRGRKSVNRVN